MSAIDPEMLIAPQAFMTRGDAWDHGEIATHQRACSEIEAQEGLIVELGHFAIRMNALEEERLAAINVANPASYALVEKKVCASRLRLQASSRPYLLLVEVLAEKVGAELAQSFDAVDLGRR